MATPALLSRALCENGAEGLARTPLWFLQHKTVANVLSGLAATELLGDKVPNVPDRIRLPSLLFRTASGALVGAALYLNNHRKPAKGAAVGAAAAFAATYASFYLRKKLGEKTSIADPVIGSIEDALVLSSGITAARM